MNAEISQQLAAHLAADPIASATLNARKRLGIPLLSVQLGKGGMQAVIVTFEKRKRTIKTVSGWMPGYEMVEWLNAYEGEKAEVA